MTIDILIFGADGSQRLEHIEAPDSYFDSRPTPAETE